MSSLPAQDVRAKNPRQLTGLQEAICELLSLLFLPGDEHADHKGSCHTRHETDNIIAECNKLTLRVSRFCSCKFA
jgi:hypothetical protein